MCYVRPFFVFLAAGAGDFRGKPLLPPLLPPIARAVRRLSEVIAIECLCKLLPPGPRAPEMKEKMHLHSLRGE